MTDGSRRHNVICGCFDRSLTYRIAVPYAAFAFIDEKYGYNQLGESTKRQFNPSYNILEIIYEERGLDHQDSNSCVRIERECPKVNLTIPVEYASRVT